MGGIFKQYSWVVDILGVLFCSFFLAKISSVYLGKALEVKRSIGVLATAEVSPISREKKDLAAYDPIIARNIFDPTERAKEGSQADEGVVEEEASLTGEAVLTSLSINVLGVLVVGEGRDKRSSATIAGGSSSPPPERGRGRGKKKSRSSGGAKVYSVGGDESFAPNTKLVLIQPDRIEFVNNGRLEYAEVGPDSGANIFGPPVEATTVAAVETKSGDKKESLIKGDGGKFTVDKREVDNALQNLDRLYTEIRAVPNFSGNKVSGMKILSVKKGSIFSKLGMKRGDVLQKINGLELDVKKGFEIFNQLKDKSSITLDLIRQGQPTTLEYEIR
ncbi:MAG: hypothetical protein HN337_08860 [Deltaproteobacteria bacterium]|jgi:type II secretion system protein C|nr:hypothetical protein [Deltaproteobacteria bacterium]